MRLRFGTNDFSYHLFRFILNIGPPFLTFLNKGKKHLGLSLILYVASYYLVTLLYRAQNRTVMNTKTTLTIVTIAIAATMLVVSSMANVAFASFSEGKGHERDCVQGERNFGEDCPGESQKSPQRDERTFAGKSGNLKDIE